MTRRALLSMLAAVPFVGRIFEPLTLGSRVVPDGTWAAGVPGLRRGDSFMIKGTYVVNAQPWMPRPGDVVTVSGLPDSWIVGRDGAWVKRG